MTVNSKIPKIDWKSTSHWVGDMGLNWVADAKSSVERDFWGYINLLPLGSTSNIDVILGRHLASIDRH